MARSAKQAEATRPPPRLRRAYYECRYGQLHLHNAIPSGGGFDELTPVICLHDAGETGRVFAPLLAALGDLRSVYAFDLPGSGESDPAPGVEAADLTLHAVTDFVGSMRIRSFDLLARGAACKAVPQIIAAAGSALRRVVLMAPPASLRGDGRFQVLSPDDLRDHDLPQRIVTLLAP